MAGNMKIMPSQDVTHLDAILLDENGHLKPVPSAVLAAIEPDQLLIWGTRNAVYQFITTEMIDWLEAQIGGRSAIEICAGNGGIGRALGIPRTDSFIQQHPKMRLVYRFYGQEPTLPPADVQKFEALEAARHFKPQVVVGAFVTQIYKEGQMIPSSIYGVDEEQLLQEVDTYILFGNKHTHQGKRIFQLPHERYKVPWLFTKALDQSLNRIWVWRKN